MTDSSTGGYLQPAAAPLPVEDAALEDVLQAMVAGITGLDGSLVRPRWQPVMPKQPEPSVNWCAIGVTTLTPEPGTAQVLHDDTIDGHDTLIRHEDMELLASFYGPQAQSYACMLRDGLQIAQNREAIAQSGIAFISTGQLLAVPELYNQQWIRRYDLTVQLRRVINRTYGVLNIVSADTIIEADVNIISNQ